MNSCGLIMEQGDKRKRSVLHKVYQMWQAPSAKKAAPRYVACPVIRLLDFQ